MPKRSDPPLSAQEQSARFLQAMRDIEAADDLRPDAEAAFERTLRGIKKPPKPPDG